MEEQRPELLLPHAPSSIRREYSRRRGRGCSEISVVQMLVGGPRLDAGATRYRRQNTALQLGSSYGSIRKCRRAFWRPGACCDVADNPFEDPKVAELYDALDSDRSDLVAYQAMASEFGAGSVLDLGCGTGVLACLLVDAGFDVIAADPAEAMLAVARAKPGAARVRWLHGVAADLPPVQVDVVTMTGNVAQVFLDDHEWAETLTAASAALRRGGVLAFETRRPERRAWEGWNRDTSYEQIDVRGIGMIETWEDLIDVSLPLVTFRSTIVFHADGSVVTATSTLRFRTLEEVCRSINAAGLTLLDVRDAPDRPGNEHVFLARRP